MGSGKKVQDAKDSYEVQLEDEHKRSSVTVFQQRTGQRPDRRALAQSDQGILDLTGANCVTSG